MTAATLRAATVEDVPGILDIVNHVIAHTAAIYMNDPQTLDQRRAWLEARLAAGYPVIVAVGELPHQPSEERVLGFSSFGEFRGAFPGYLHSVEHSVHVHQEARGQGLGRRLMQALYPMAAAMGKHIMIGAIDAANPVSIALHEREGFERTAFMPEVGRKFGRWLDLVFMQRVVGPGPADALAPTPASSTLTDPGVLVRAIDRPSPAQLTQLAEVLTDCVHGGASVHFMLPFEAHEALAFWQRTAASVVAGERLLFVAEQGGRVVGTAQLVLAMPPNQAHRADVAKMLVHRSARRMGVAAALLKAIDQAASQRGRRLLVLDTVTGSDAERLYRRAGWQVSGVIPDFALFPQGGVCSTTVMFKRVPAV